MLNGNTQYVKHLPVNFTLKRNIVPTVNKWILKPCISVLQMQLIYVCKIRKGGSELVMKAKKSSI